MMLRQLLLLPLMLITAVVYAQTPDLIQPDSIKKLLEAEETIEAIKIDGKLNETTWQKVKPSPRFIQVDPYQGAAPNFDTKIKVLYNEKYLYVGVTCLDSLGKAAIRATDFKRDFNFQTGTTVKSVGC